MYHSRHKGNHYEIGFVWGKRLRLHDVHLLDQVPFPIHAKHIQFAQECIPYYQKYFPEILEEIQGISEGNDCSYETLAGVLLSMYCILPGCHCSCFALRNEQGAFFGRNSDFLTEIEKSYLNVIYHFSNDSYAFEGNTTAFVEMEDGINEHGLAIGLTSVFPKQIQPGLNAGMLLRLFLEKCKTVDDVIALLTKVKIASAQTFTLIDANKEIACIECCPSQIHVEKSDGPCAYVCASNTFHASTMLEHKVKIEDDWQAEERYATMKETFAKDLAVMDHIQAMELLEGKKGFLCQYDRQSGRDTVWSVLYDVSKQQLYRVEGNPSRRKFQIDRRFLK